MNNNVQVDKATSSAQEQGEDLQKYAVLIDDLALKVSSMTAKGLNNMAASLVMQVLAQQARHRHEQL